MIRVEQVSFAYAGHVELFSDISFSLERGELVALIGPNGSGKSTLALLLNGLFQPSTGKVVIDDMDTANPEHRHDICRRVGIVFQNPEEQIVADTVEEEIAFGLELLNKSREDMLNRVANLLDEFHLRSLAQRNPEELSGGEKQRLTLAATLATGAEYLVFDEPTALLDWQGRQDLLHALEDLRRDMGILFITPYLEEIDFADRLLYLENGTLREIPQQEREKFCRALENEN